MPNHTNSSTFLNVMLDLTALNFWGLYSTQVIALGATILLFFAMSKNLKRDLICPTKLCTTHQLCEGCNNLRQLLDYSFKKFLVIFVSFMSFFILRFSLYSATRLSHYTSNPLKWRWTKPWFFYLTYLTEFGLIIQIIVMKYHTKT